MSTLGIELALDEYADDPTVEKLAAVVRGIVDALEELDRSKSDDDNYRSCGCC